MQLEIGSRVGSYEVVGLLGAGAMGEVYRARDTRLGRDLALKVLPSAFAAEPDRLARFEREARLLASLCHANIAVLYSLEQTTTAPSGSVRFVTMELAAGEDLAEWLKRGPIEVADAIAIGRQIAEALEAAHEKGIVHRDLKPANVKVAADGQVKVLDFGLAKAWRGDDRGGGGSRGRRAIPAAQVYRGPCSRSGFNPPACSTSSPWRRRTAFSCGCRPARTPACR